MTNDSSLPRIFVILTTSLLLILSAMACGDDIEPGGDNGDNADVVDHFDVGTNDVQDNPDAEHDPDAIDDPDTGDEPDTGDNPDTGGEEPDVIEEPEELPDLAVDDLRPSRGPVQGGTPFVIDGEGFTDDTAVLFGSVEANVHIIDEALTGTTPPSAATGPVTVRILDDITGEVTLVDGFTYIDPLAIDSVQPSMLDISGGIEVTLQGSGFTDDTRVTVNNRAAPGETFLDSGQMRFIAPPNPEGPADLRLTNEDSTYIAEGAITYVAPVEISSVEPPFGFVSGGDEVIIYGDAFESDMNVYFDELPAIVIDVSDDGSHAVVHTPANTEAIVDVRVETSADGARLHDGFAYIGDGDGASRLDGVVPDRGETFGGELIYLVGNFKNITNPSVTFGGSDASIIDSNDHLISVHSPANSSGTVDVEVTDADETLIAENAFTYYVPLTIADVTPDEGDVSGGTPVTVTGAGFTNADELSLAGVSVDFDVIDDETIQFTTPSAGAGSADLILSTDDERTAILEDAFYFIDNLELWSFEPTRGSIAGNTYVEIRGQGFTEDTEIYFGGLPATDVDLIDPYTVAARTPAQPSAGVEVTAEVGNDTSTASELYTYFNPGASTGGAWGNPIDGAVNVTVFTITSAPIEDAFVMLSTNANTAYTGITDSTGRVTLSGPDVIGQQTITATAADHSSTTVQYVDAENITLFLHPEADGDPQFPPPPPTATFTGEITGLDKLDIPAPDERLVAYVESTRPGIMAQIPDPGAQNTVYGDGEYTITTRVGDLALIVTAGIQNITTNEFTPQRMGVARSITASNGGEYEIDIPLDIPLTSSMQLKYNGAPLAPGGPNTNRAQTFMDLGIDGFYGPIQEYSTDQDILEIDRLGALTGDLSDVRYRILATTDTSGGLPQSLTFVRGIDELGLTYDTNPMISTIDIITPAPTAAPTNGIVQWELDGLHEPDIYYVTLQTGMGETVWDIFLPGSATSFQFPDFPDFTALGITDIPFPYPGGLFSMNIYGFAKEGLSAEDFTYDDLNTLTADGVSIASMLISF